MYILFIENKEGPQDQDRKQTKNTKHAVNKKMLIVVLWHEKVKRPKKPKNQIFKDF